ncbi:MAG: TIGR01777 family oxidoreductase [Actinobacteria bacterium]|nr:TIGR01777 family oxidoreductase [Actinomycetota bacterium]
MKVAVTGSHGLIGRAVVRALAARGDEVVPLVRSEPRSGEVVWDPQAGTIDAQGLEGVDAVVHLAGEGIGDRRWTPTHKARVLDSRVRGTTLIAETIAGLSKKPDVLVSASAIGFYGDRADEILTEESAKGDDFLAHVVDQWETSTSPAEDAGIRVVKIRTGLVLSEEGGILPKMMLPLRFFVGGRLGSGRQYMSWIALDDELGAILHLLDSDVSGPVNLTSPNPVTNAEFTKVLAEVMHRPAFLAVPAFALKLALGSEMAKETVLVSQRALPARLESSGYTFRHPELLGALNSEC